MYRSALLSLCLVPLALAADITGQVLLDPFPNHALPVGSKVVLDHGARSSFILYDGTFSLPNVPEGEHILDTLIPGYTLPATLYTINSTSVHAQPYIISRLPFPLSSPSLPLPLTLIAAKDDYYTSPPGVNIIGMLKNPMVLMMLFSAVMMFFMPKIMASMEMDPEMAKEMADTQKKMQGMKDMDFMGSLSSILSGEQTAPAPAPAASGKNASGNNSKKGKRR